MCRDRVSAPPVVADGGCGPVFSPPVVLAGWDLHEYRHSALTHLGEQGASLLMLMAKSRHKKPENVRRYFKPSPEAIAELPACSRRATVAGNRIGRRMSTATSRCWTPPTTAPPTDHLSGRSRAFDLTDPEPCPPVDRARPASPGADAPTPNRNRPRPPRNPVIEPGDRDSPRGPAAGAAGAFDERE